MFAVGADSAQDRARLARKPADARRPAHRRPRATALAPSRRTPRRVLAHVGLLRYSRSTIGALSADYAQRYGRLDEQRRVADRQPRQAASVGRRTIVAADLPGRRQPCAREDRQSAAAGGDARLRADDSQCRTRGQRCADRLPDGTRVGSAL